jgi:hypothetical protein
VWATFILCASEVILIANDKLKIYDKRPRCENCERQLFNTDFARGLAESYEYWYDTFNGPDCKDCYHHTYNCESEKRRRIK